MVVSANYGGTAVQVAYQLGTRQIYQRYCSSGNWSEWVDYSHSLIKHKEVVLTYYSPNEMYTVIEASEIDYGTPVSLVIYNVEGTPYNSVISATATKISSEIRCMAVNGNAETPFVQGHVLSADISYI